MNSSTSTPVEQYQAEFVSFLPALTSYLYRIVTNRQEAEDLAQETYLKAFGKIASFRGRSSFRTWVFAIATNLARDSKRAQTRWGENWMDLVRAAHVESPTLLARKFEVQRNSPHGKFVMHEHLNYCFTCTSKTLLLNQQICLLLKEIYGFSLEEIRLITGLSEGKAKHALANARKHMSRIFEHKCALINKQGTCSQCTGLNGIFNPKQDAQAEANKLKLRKEQKQQNYEELLKLRLQMIAALDPLAGEGIDLHNYLLEHSPQWAQKQAQKQAQKKIK